MMNDDERFHALACKMSYMEPSQRFHYIKRRSDSYNDDNCWYRYDRRWSNKYIAVYVHTVHLRAIIAFRGTSDITDLSHDIGIMFAGMQAFGAGGVLAMMPRLRIVDNIIKSLPNYVISVTGHSLGGYIAAMIAFRYSNDLRGNHHLFNAGSSGIILGHWVYWRTADPDTRITSHHIYLDLLSISCGPRKKVWKARTGLNPHTLDNFLREEDYDNWKHNVKRNDPRNLKEPPAEERINKHLKDLTKDDLILVEELKSKFH